MSWLGGRDSNPDTQIQSLAPTRVASEDLRLPYYPAPRANVGQRGASSKLLLTASDHIVQLARGLVAVAFVTGALQVAHAVVTAAAERDDVIGFRRERRAVAERGNLTERIPGEHQLTQAVPPALPVVESRFARPWRLPSLAGVFFTEGTITQLTAAWCTAHLFGSIRHALMLTP